MAWLSWFAALGISAQEGENETVVWYAGTSRTTSPDGETVYGPAVNILVKRIVQPAQNRILEIVHHPGERFEAQLIRLEKSTTFAASDEGKSWTGFLEFSGKEWSWDSWSYFVRMSDGSGSLIGKAKLMERTFTIEKFFHDAAGKKKARLFEELRSISENEYQDRLRKMQEK